MPRWPDTTPHAAEATRIDARKVEQELRLDEWTAPLSRQTPLVRQVLKKLLVGVASPCGTVELWTVEISGIVAA